MKIITKELCLLDVEDLEPALSKHFGCPIRLSEIDCSLAHHRESGLTFQFDFGDDCCDAEDLFEDRCLYGKKLSLSDPMELPVELILNFDVSCFKSFDDWAHKDLGEVHPMPFTIIK